MLLFGHMALIRKDSRQPLLTMLIPSQVVERERDSQALTTRQCMWVLWV